MQISDIQLQQIKSLYERGLYLQAFQSAQTIAPLPKWEGTKARIFAARLASTLGAGRTASCWMIQAWRRDKSNGEAIYYRAKNLTERYGALRALSFMKSQNANSASMSEVRADWYALYGSLFGQLRDFNAADEWLTQAENTEPTNAWVWVERAKVLDMEDRYEESLATSRYAMKLRPYYPPAVLSCAHTLIISERYDEALSLLKEAARETESAWVVARLADLQSELGLHKEAVESLELFNERTPMREDILERWLYSRLADAAYMSGDTKWAIRYGEIASTPFHERLAKNLTQLKGGEKRIQLPVGFVRQHHVTCAPATLSNVCRYWKKQANHLNIAEEICYDGTTEHSQRLWAEKNGWAVCEFTLNWKNAVELINRGIPFTLATTHPGGGHMQAVIGYDERREVILIRDPYYQSVDEMLIDELLEEQKSFGPYCMALVPKEKKELLDGIDFKEKPQRDFLFALQNALHTHNRQRANEIYEQMASKFPRHYLTLRAKWSLAGYDQNHVHLLAAIEELLAIFPDDVNLKMTKLHCLRQQSAKDERVKLLLDLCKSEKTDPLFWYQYAAELSSDARQHPKAMRWAWRAAKARPADGANVHLLANIFWSRRNFDVGLELYRFAACMNDKDEEMARSYFLAARALKQTDRALKFLRDRFRRYGKLANYSGITLFHCLRETGETKKAFDVLKEALTLRPDDGELKLFAAEALARYGQIEKAEKLLQQSTGRTTQSSRLRTSALISSLKNDLKSSLEAWRKIAETEPLALDAHQSIAQLLAETESLSATNEYLKTLIERFPFNCGLYKLHVEWLQNGREDIEPALKKLIEIDPQDAWARREHANLLSKKRRYDEALQEADFAIQLEPDGEVNHWLRGNILSQANRNKDAAICFKKALELSVDADFALRSWLSVCPTAKEKREVIQFVKEQLAIQTTMGNGVLAFREQAKNVLESQELLTLLKNLHQERKDLWHAWAAVVSQLIDMHLLDDAHKLAQQATERFPLISPVWVLYSQVYKAKGDSAREIDSLKQALNINPTWSEAIQDLVDAYERAGKLDEAKTLLLKAIEGAPLDNFLHGYLAQVLWMSDEKEAAIERLKQAIKIEPAYDWAWTALREWTQSLGRSDEAVQIARKLTEEKPNEAFSWFALARLLSSPGEAEERLSVLEKAVRLNPKNGEIYYMHALTLAKLGRFNEAIAVCRALELGDHQPGQLRYLEACIALERGAVEDAIERLESVVKDIPEYTTAIEHLAEIYRDTKRNAAFLRVAQEYVRVAPRDPSALGLLGQAFFFNNQREQAKAAFQKAVALSPQFDMAAFALFDLCFEDKQYNETISTLKILQKHHEGGALFTREVEFYNLNRDYQNAKMAWQKLCFTKVATVTHFHRAVDSFIDAGMQNAIFDWIEFAVDNPQTNPVLGRVWAELCLMNKKLSHCHQRLMTMQNKGELWHYASELIIEEIVKAGEKEMFDEFVSAHGNILHTDTTSWGVVGHAFATFRDYNAACRWMSDWKFKTDATPAFLWNLAVSLRRTNKFAEAAEVSCHALQLKEDGLTQSHRVMLGLDEAFRGSIESAQNLSSQIEQKQLRDWDKYFYHLLNSLLDVYKNAAGQTKNHDDSIKRLLNLQTAYPTLWKDDLMRRTFMQSVKQALGTSKSSFKNWWIYTRLNLHVMFRKK